jgi:hypothetical protein
MPVTMPLLLSSTCLCVQGLLAHHGIPGPRAAPRHHPTNPQVLLAALNLNHKYVPFVKPLLGQARSCASQALKELLVRQLACAYAHLPLHTMLTSPFTRCSPPPSHDAHLPLHTMLTSPFTRCSPSPS